MKKMNNKGFSLVELIVVIAIMAILAVTLAPRLSQYVEKSRKASDQEAVNTIFTAAKLANVESPLGKSVDAIDLGGTDALFNISDDDKDWTLNPSFPPEDDEDKNFWDLMIEVLSDFELKSNEVGDNTQITLETDDKGKVTVILSYDGSSEDYKLSE